MPSALCLRPPMSPSISTRPDRPSVRRLKARLASMAEERVEIPLIIGGKEIRTGKTAQAVMPFNHRHVLADWHMAEPKHIKQAIDAALEARTRVVDVAVGGSRRGPAQGRRAARDAAGARHGQRRDDAGAGEDGVPVGDRRGVRADRFLALQRRLRAGALQRAAAQPARRLEPARVPRRSRASSTRSRRSTSRRSAATSRRAPVLMGGVSIWKPASSAMLSALLRDEACSRRSGPAAGRDQLPAGQRRR